MAIDPAQYQQQGQQYASGLAASQDPFINLYRNRLGSMKSREALAAEIAGLYNPAIEAARGVGTNVANVGQAGLAAMTGLASSLPGMGVEGLSEAYRGAARAGGSAALMGSVLETGARQGLAESILERQLQSQQEQFGTEERLAGAESEKARIGADWLGAAQGFQGMGSQYLQDVAQDQATRFAAEKHPLELETMRVQIANIMADTSLTEQQKASMIQEMQFNEQLQPGAIEQQQAQTNNIRLNNQQLREQITTLKTMRPFEIKNALLSNNMLVQQIAGQALTNADARTTLLKAGYKVSNNGTVRDPSGKVIFQPPRPTG